LTWGELLPTLVGMAVLPSNISSLSAAEKLELIDALWEDLETHPEAVSTEQAEELDRRIAIYEKNPPVGSTWEQIKAGLPKR
jgi:putative addiction module component (TIGR02574 family)